MNTYLKPPWFFRKIFNPIAMAAGVAHSETLTVIKRTVAVSGAFEHGEVAHANRAGAPAIRRRCRCRTPIRCRV
jgi:hypothetical protein